MSAPAPRRQQRGATLIEFALVLIIFLTFLLGVVDFARLLWTWNAATEATRWGARVAVVCDKGSGWVLDRMQKFLPQLTASQVAVDWYANDATGVPAVNNACTAANCVGVNVRIQNLNFQWISPMAAIAGSAWTTPGFSTYLPRESMGQDTNSSAVCSAP